MSSLRFNAPKGGGRRMLQRNLLIVDDEPLVARGLQRLLTINFDKVLVAHSAAEAQAILSRQNASITHVLCDHYLGEDQPVGFDLLPAWRARFAGIRVAVLLSGSEIRTMARRPEIDAFVAKPPDVAELREALMH